ncbi:hypothetical protein BGZ59_000690 [Podila verticillata]|nr:hypothetical protein BGZ59_000690 [Podila verticillata]
MTFKISKSFSKASASMSIASAQSTPRSSMSVDQPSPVQNKTESSSANAHYKTSSMAYAGPCKIYPTKFLYEKYALMIQERLSSLPTGDRNRVAPNISQVLSRLQGDDDGVIAKTIFSRFHKNCRDKPPRRSPHEVCGSAKSIACFAPWGHTHSVFDSVHEAVVKTLRDALKGESGNSAVHKALVTDIRKACPSQCGGWVEPFQTLMLKWEQTEHYNAYGNRTPNCSKDSLAF